MKLLLLGTAAAEGWPAPFCTCAACEESRRRGGANIRGRSNALLDDDLKIDWGPDAVSQLQRCNRHAAHIRTLLFTHQHHDHIVPGELAWARPPFTNTPPERIAVYGNAQVLEMLRVQFPDPEKSAFDLHLLEAGREVTTAAGDTILPLPADHVAGALTLLVQRGGTSLFYGHDSGLYPDETLRGLEAHAKEHGPLGIVLMDCTSGGQVTSNRGHMGVDGVIAMKAELERRGVVGPPTRVVATHFSHNGKLGHEELARALGPHNIETAFDGMVVEA